MLRECEVLYPSGHWRWHIPSLDSHLGLTFRAPSVWEYTKVSPGFGLHCGCWGCRVALGRRQLKIWQFLHYTVPFPFGLPHLQPPFQQIYLYLLEKKEITQIQKCQRPAGTDITGEYYALSQGITPSLARGNWICDRIWSSQAFNWIRERSKMQPAFMLPQLWSTWSSCHTRALLNEPTLLGEHSLLSNLWYHPAPRPANQSRPFVKEPYQPKRVLAVAKYSTAFTHPPLFLSAKKML